MATAFRVPAHRPLIRTVQQLREKQAAQAIDYLVRHHFSPEARAVALPVIRRFDASRRQRA